MVGNDHSKRFEFVNSVVKGRRIHLLKCHLFLIASCDHPCTDRVVVVTHSFTETPSQAQGKGEIPVSDSENRHARMYSQYSLSGLPTRGSERTVGSCSWTLFWSLVGTSGTKFRVLSDVKATNFVGTRDASVRPILSTGHRFGTGIQPFCIT